MPAVPESCERQMTASAPKPVVLAAENLEVAYGPHVVLREVTLQVAKGELVAISGPNGGGKSTFLKACLGLKKPIAGSIEIFGKPAGDRDALVRVGYVPQRPKVFQDFPGSVRDVVQSGAWPKVGMWKKLPSSCLEAVSKAIEACGLRGLERRRVSELSGGMQQRVFLARALANSPQLLLLDEPLAGIDLPSQMDFRRLLVDLTSSGEMTVVVVMHEYGPFEGLVSRLVILAEKILYDGQAPRHKDAEHEHYSLPSGYLSLLKEIGEGVK